MAQARIVWNKRKKNPINNMRADLVKKNMFAGLKQFASTKLRDPDVLIGNIFIARSVDVKNHTQLFKYPKTNWLTICSKQLVRKRVKSSSILST